MGFNPTYTMLEGACFTAGANSCSGLYAELWARVRGVHTKHFSLKLVLQTIF